jgi:hypothetical protein
VTGLDSGAADPEIKKWASRGYLLKKFVDFHSLYKTFSRKRGVPPNEHHSPSLILFADT